MYIACLPYVKGSLRIVTFPDELGDAVFVFLPPHVRAERRCFLLFYNTAIFSSSNFSFL